MGPSTVVIPMADDDFPSNPRTTLASSSSSKRGRATTYCGRAGMHSLSTGMWLLGLGLCVTSYSIAQLAFLVVDHDRGGMSYTSSRRNRILYQNHKRPVRISSHPVTTNYLPQRPRMVGAYFESSQSDTYMATERIPVNTYRLHKTHTSIVVSRSALEFQKRLKEGSRDYRRVLADPQETETCHAQYDWQLAYRPNCNHVMELDMTRLQLDAKNDTYVKLLANGYWRDVWKLQGVRSDETTVLKTMRFAHEVTPRNLDRHRRDAVAMEQLTSSPWVMGVYGFCGNSGIFEFADGGSLEDSIFEDEKSEKEWSPAEKLVVAYQVAAGLAAVHNFPKEGVAAIAHTDITSSQYVYVASAGFYKLNDFNRCRFITWDAEKNEACSFEVGNNPGTFRSPEEYAYEGETEKIDVYSMGNIFYGIMTGLYPFEEEKKSKKAASLVKGGHRPPISYKILNSTDPFDQALLNATRRCWEQNPKVRPSSREIQKYLEDTLIRLGVQKS